LGDLYAAAGQTELAIKNYSRSIELNPRAEPRVRPIIEALKGD
jgi:hypothetical protein